MVDRSGPTLPTPRSFVPVCAIGASAGGVGVLQTLFRLLPDDLGLAYVVIVHLSPDHPSAMHEILGACTRMPVYQVQDGPALRANCVYVIAPDRELVIEGDDVKSRPFTDPRGRRAPIDMFFRSIAAARGDGIAVVLTGAGSDGAVGVRAIKEAGGIVMVQEPAEAGFPSMPQNAIATGVADVVAPVARLAERLAEAARSKEAVRSLDEDGAANDLRRIVAFLRTRTGHDFSGYKRATVLRRVMRRMQVCQITDLDSYARHMRATPEEAKALFADLLISVTMFFRDPAAYRALAHAVVKPLLERAGEDDGSGEIRVWVVGCATGEEAYSMAILLLEEADRLKLHVPAQIFATDLDEGALATAREGRYPRSIEADVSPERLKRFFVDEGTHYRIQRRVRDLVLFATHSVVREPPFMRLDLVTCRNVLIYLERTLQQHVCAIFHYGLKPGGALFLGTAETADMVQDQFIAVDREARIYCARGLGGVPIPVLSPSTPMSLGRSHPTTEGRVLPSRFEAGEVLGASHAAALETSAPPSALVDADHAVLHLSPTAGRFIRLSAGPLSGRLPTIVQPELRLDLKMALDRAFDTRQPSITRLVDLRLDGEMRRVSIHIAPIPSSEGAAARAIAFFLDSGPSLALDAPGNLPASDDLRQLHGELKAAQEAALVGRIGQEAALQELRASNEELQSLNEEYRSTAEELETSKEELQSINEELQTVNAELKTKLSAISAAHDDLQNLTASSEIGTLFLDTGLRIRMFTPRVAELINVTQADIGRPVTDFTHRLDYDRLEADVRRVLRDLQSIEAEVRGLGERWFTLRVRPYRTLDDRVEGAVVTFDDITERKRNEAALHESESRYRTMFQTMNEGYLLADVVFDEREQPVDIACLEANPAATRMLGVDVTGRRLREVDPDYEDYWYETFGRVALTGVSEQALLYAKPGDTWYDVHVSKVYPDQPGNRRITIRFFDATARVRAEHALRESERLFRTLADTAPALIWQNGAEGENLFVNRRFNLYTGRTAEDIRGDGWRTLIHPDDAEHYIASYMAAVRAQSAWQDRNRLKRHDGVWCWFENYAQPVFDHGGRYMGHVGVSTDVTSTVQAEQASRESEILQRALIEGTPQIVWRATGDGAWTWASPQWTAYTGQTEADSRGDGWLEALHPDDRAPAKAAWAQSLAGAPLVMEVRIRHGASGAYRWFQSRALPVRDQAGVIVEWLGTSTDVDDLRRLREQQNVLVAELQHRTRNLIGVVRGTADATLRSSSDLGAFASEFRDRLSALARVQGLLSRLDEGQRVAFDDLLRAELSAVGAPNDEEGRVTLDGPAGIGLKSRSVQTLALALHELATNAAKYGAFKQPNGRLAVRWRLEQPAGSPEPWLHVDWHESGVIMAAEDGSSKGGGAGRTLIEHALPYELGAKTYFVMAADGVRCSISLPVSARPTASTDDQNENRPR